MMITLFVFILCISIYGTNGNEWDCALSSNTGTFIRFVWIKFVQRAFDEYNRQGMGSDQ